MSQSGAPLPSRVVAHAHGRVGFLGNPSDGFGGKTISFALQNFVAEVTVEEHPVLEFVPNPRFDRFTFASTAELVHATRRSGYYGGMRILQAAVKRFADVCEAAGQGERLAARNFRISYSTTIPVQVGMAGSSAIISAAFKAMMRFYGLRLADLRVSKAVLPDVILSVERSELGIAAGLQDRVVQVYQGLVFMDFSAELFARQGHGDYVTLDPALLPDCYVAWVTEAAGESGKAHSDVRSRWERGDAEVREGMRQFAQLAQEGRDALAARDTRRLCQLMEANFALRRKLYGDAVIGEHSLRMIELAGTFGFSAKFTGSGGAIVLLREAPLGDEDHARVEAAFAELGCGFARAIPQREVEEEFE